MVIFCVTLVLFLERFLVPSEETGVVERSAGGEGGGR